MKLDDYDNGVAEYGPLPNWYDSDGGDIGPLKTCRSVLIAPFGARKRWMSKDKGDRKTGNHLLQLAYVAYVGDDRKVIPWGPMILSMKVTTVMEYEKLLKEWSVTTYDARHEFAGGAPAHFFLYAHRFVWRKADTVYCWQRAIYVKGHASAGISIPPYQRGTD
jgi:hypothetical protein